MLAAGASNPLSDWSISIFFNVECQHAEVALVGQRFYAGSGLRMPQYSRTPGQYASV